MKLGEHTRDYYLKEKPVILHCDHTVAVKTSSGAVPGICTNLLEDLRQWQRNSEMQVLNLGTPSLSRAPPVSLRITRHYLQK